MPTPRLPPPGDDLADLSPISTKAVVHADDQITLTMFQPFCCLRLGPGLVHRPIRVIGRRVDRIQL